MIRENYFLTEVINTDLDNEKVVIKMFSESSGVYRVHKTTSFLEKYPKSKDKNIKIADKLVNYLNYLHTETQEGTLKSIEHMTIDDCQNYINKIKGHVTHAELNSQKRLFTKFLYFLAKNNYLRKIKKSDFSFDSKLGNNVLKIPFK